ARSDAPVATDRLAPTPCARSPVAQQRLLADAEIGDGEASWRSPKCFAVARVSRCCTPHESIARPHRAQISWVAGFQLSIDRALQAEEWSPSLPITSFGGPTLSYCAPVLG